MIRRQVDPAQLSGEALANWYRRSPEDLQEERDLRERAQHEAFFGPGGDDQGGLWQEARVARPQPRMVDTPAPRPLEWHAAEEPYRSALKGAMDHLKVPQPPSFGLRHTPAHP